MRSNFIEVNNITYSYQKNKIFNNASVNFQKDNISFLIGPNGSGKTTLTKLILGILKLKDNHGRILVNGVNINSYNLAGIGQRIGYLFQNPDKQLFNPTVKDELHFYNKYVSTNKANYEMDVIKLLQLDNIMNHKVINLSEGEKRRLALACIMQMKPQYLILDEPSSGLDNENKEKLTGILHALKKEYFIGSLIISHNKFFINNLADDIYI